MVRKKSISSNSSNSDRELSDVADSDDVSLISELDEMFEQDITQVAERPVLKLRRLRAEVAVAMRSSGGRGERGPDCELTVILERGLGPLGPPLPAEEELETEAAGQLSGEAAL
ncbi:hypothetical protein QE152_g31355 [Popillia japonica]|uniref:Uncharacterized protein n=1 Tax=Popillia japonica TaxID=7064 RepID=A0AAW1J1Z5_POPJA